MKDKELHSRIYDSLLVLQYPEMAAACVRAGINKAEFIAIHEHMMGRLPAPASEDDTSDEDQDDMVNLLQTIPE